MTRSRRNRKKKSRDAPVAVDDSHSNAAKIEALTKEAEAAIDKFQYADAEVKVREALQIDSNNCKCLEILSSIYFERFQLEESKALLKQCVELSPDVGFTKYFSLGQLCTGMESLRCYEKGIEILKNELENSENVEPSKEQGNNILKRNLSDAYCSISELFMTDCCFEENAEDRCNQAIDLALKSDPGNPVAYQCLAQFQLIKNQEEEAKESMEKSLSLWLPNHERMREESEVHAAILSENRVPEYDIRMNAGKLLIELKMFYEASKVLEGLLDEHDEIVEVWYLLGWLNYLREGDEYKNNAHFCFKKAKQVSIKLEDEDNACIAHVNELLEELSSTHPISDEENELACGEDASDGDFSTESDDEDSDDQESGEEMEI